MNAAAANALGIDAYAPAEIATRLETVAVAKAAMALLPQMALPAPSKRAWVGSTVVPFLRRVNHSPIRTAPKTDKNRAGMYIKGMLAKK